MLEKLFIDDIIPSDDTYRFIRDENTASAARLRSDTVNLWNTYRPYADKDFRKQLAHDFDARFGEMYLTCTLIHKSFDVVPKQGRARGPDIKLTHASTTIWVEAVTPTTGVPGKPNSVPRPKTGVAQDIPDEQMTLRYCSVIRDKYFTKYFTYLKDGIVRSGDCYVIALNGCRMPWRGGDYEPPRIVRSVLPFGWQWVTVDTSSHSIVNQGHHYRPYLSKASGEKVDTDIFAEVAYHHISAVMSSEVNVANPISVMGEDFVIVNNPLASSKLPNDFPRVGRKYDVHFSENKITVFPRDLGQH